MSEIERPDGRLAAATAEIEQLRQQVTDSEHREIAALRRAGVAEQALATERATVRRLRFAIGQAISKLDSLDIFMAPRPVIAIVAERLTAALATDAGKEGEQGGH